MKFTKGQSGNPGGRPKGAKNKLPKEVTDMVLEALQNAGGRGGGVAYLTKQAKERPVAFLHLIAKLVKYKDSPAEEQLPTPVFQFFDNGVKPPTSERELFDYIERVQSSAKP